MKLAAIILGGYLFAGIVWYLLRGLWLEAIDGVRERTHPNRVGSASYHLACVVACVVGGAADTLVWPYAEWKYRKSWEGTEDDTEILEDLILELHGLPEEDQDHIASLLSHGQDHIASLLSHGLVKRIAERAKGIRLEPEEQPTEAKS